MTIREHIGYWPGGVTVVATDPRNGWVFAWEDLRGLVQVWHDRRIVDLFEIPDGMYPDLPTLDRARVYALGIPAEFIGDDPDLPEPDRSEHFRLARSTP